MKTAKKTKLTPEQVRRVTEKVYALWLKEAEIDRERKRPSNQPRYR